MSYEINIIAVNQKKKSKTPLNSSISLHNEIDNEEVHRYSEIWPFYSSMPGILYSLVKEMNEGYFSSFPLCDSDFESVVSDNLFPKWIGEEEKYNLTPFIIKENFYKDFEQIITLLIKQTLCKTIMFQTRYQGGDYEIIYGVIKLKKFLKMIRKKEILFNVCYIVTDE